jgi:hypothetical protein
VTLDRRELPLESFVGLGGSITGEHAADKAAHDVRAEREAGGFLALACTFETGTIQKRAKRQHVRTLLELAEQLLSGKQRWFLPALFRGGGLASIAREWPGGKGVQFLATLCHKLVG